MKPFLKIPLDAARRIFSRQPTADSRKLELRLSDATWPDKLARMKSRLELAGDDDELMQGIMGLLDAFVRTELEPTVSAGLDDAEAHRLRGRIGMLLDFKAELQKVWSDARDDQAKRRIH